MTMTCRNPCAAPPMRPHLPCETRLRGGMPMPPIPEPWAPYTPDERCPWDVRRVVHLHRRAGFAATWDELQRDLKDGPRASVDRLVAGKAYTSGVPADFEPMSRVIGDAAVAAAHP